ncbi:MAG: TrkH family potassium uptake protein [Bryobacteraceae bacterium]
MIRFAAIGHILGLFLTGLGATMLLPVLIATLTPGDDVRPTAYAFAATAGAGLLLWRGIPRPPSDLTMREGIFMVVAIWVAASLFGALPFLFTSQFSLTDAIFESASGLTTTGATILAKVEVLSRSVQFWRHFTHWLGGMGIVVLGVAVLPLLGLGGLHLYRAEFSGAKSEKLRPRITETAMALWRIYAAFTAIEFVLLMLAGMDWFDAACHTFSTLGTGGFSTRSDSIAGFHSPLIEYILIVFMVLAGINFTRHYLLFVDRRPGAVLGDPEVRAYAAVLAVATVAVTATLAGSMPLEPAFRAALFQSASIMTTTGFATADFELWAPVAHAVLFALMFFGGCTGSTSGGLKASRIVLLWNLVLRDLRRTISRHGVFTVRLGREVVQEKTVLAFVNLVYLALFVHVVASLAISATGVDLLTALTSVTACMFNVGPGFGSVGPAENYSHLPMAAKWLLSFCMVAGRLEFYTALVIFHPAFWKR